MKMLKNLFAAAAVSLVALATYAGINLATTVGVPTSGEFTPVTVTAEATEGSEVAAVAIVYRTLAGGDTAVWVTNALDKVGDEYRGEIPPLPVATVEYFATATDAGGASYDTEHASYAAGDVPTTDRYWDFTQGTFVKDTGTPASDYKNDYYYDLGDGRRWTAKAVLMSGRKADMPPGGVKSALLMYNYPNEAMCNVTSPRLEGGVGTIYFTSKMIETFSEGALAVQIALVDEPGDDDWLTVKSFDFERVTEEDRLVCHAEPVVLNNYNAKRVRFLRTHPNDYSDTKTKGCIALDNIAISRPPARVDMEEQLRNPGYPSQDQPVKMRVKVTDVSDDTPSVNRRVRVFYKWTYSKTAKPSSSGWESVDMTPVGGDVYEGTISTQKVGFVNYYYRCDFDGYFYSRDPDGTDGAEILHSENLSPMYWAGGVTQLLKPDVYSQYEVRPYRSEYENVAMVSDPAKTSVDRMTLVGDEVWQCVTLVTGVTNLNFTFVGSHRYLDDATEFQAEPVVWGEDNQGFINPPLGGYVETGSTNGIQAELEYTGFLLMRFSAKDNDYIVKRAVWQDFDEWQASQDYYEESLGLYATTPYSVDFENWSSDGYSSQDAKGSSFENDTPEAGFDDFDTFTYDNWIRSKSRIVRERQILKDVNPNTAVDIQRGGFIGNSGYRITYGLSTFDYRVRSSLADNHWALYKYGTDWKLTQPLTIKPIFQLIERADSEHYLGVIFCYQDGKWGEPPGYYELRFIQASCNTGNDNYRRVELWRQDPGAEGPVQVGTSQGFPDGKLASDQKPEINVSLESGKVVVKVAAATGQATKTFTDANPGALTEGGTVGFGSYDASPEISKLEVKAGTATLYAGSKEFDAGEWYLGGKRLDSPGKTRWEIAGKKLSRAVPTQTLSIYSAGQLAGENTPDTSKLKVKNASISVNSLKYSKKQEKFKVWDRQFLQLRYVSGEGNVVVDDVRNYPWRATTRAFDDSAEAEFDEVPYYDWTSIKDQQDSWLADNNDWAVLEGWTTNTVTGGEMILEKSRANTNLVVALVSPVMTNGLGSITFTFSVTGERGAEAVYAVERTNERMIDTWTTVEVYTNHVGDSDSRYTKVATSMKGRGRLRIRLLNTSGDVALHVDNVIAKDYPPRDKTTWISYNARITDRIDNPTLIYNGTGKSAFLNNSTTDGTAGTENLSAHEPFIQSPEVGTGIGEIAFAYRAYERGVPSSIIVKAAPSEDTPEAMWRTVTNITVTEPNWVQFRDPRVFDLEDKVLRIYASTNSIGRFGIDNILVTEPVRAGYEIFKVRLLPGQPLEGSNTMVEAEIGRFMMNPQDVELYVSYHPGTNVWGYRNWWSRPDTGNRKRLFRVGPESSRLFRTVDGDGIPGGATDEVVQYVVWGVHSEISPDDPNVIFQGTNTFVNPAWYAPMDENKAHEAEGWSPYFYVYSCAPGQVWVNELNYRRAWIDDFTHEYLELAGPANASIGGWRIEVVDPDWGTTVGTFTIPANTVLPNDADGWGFFVWGSSGTPNMDVKMRDETPDDNNWYFVKTAGLKLYRSNGALEQKLAWGFDDSMDFLLEHGYEYIGVKGGSTNSLSLVSLIDKESGEYVKGTNYVDFTWVKLGQTPGEKNDDGSGDKQVFLPFVEPGLQSYLLTSTLFGEGTQNGVTDPLEIEVESGRPASVLYKAREWNRISELKANGVAIPGAAGQKSYSYEIAAMSGKVSLQATFAPWTDHGHDGVPVSWLANWTEAEIAGGDADAHSLEDEYLLNTDPTQDTTVEFVVSSILVGDANVRVSVRLDRREADGTDYGDGTLTGMGINGILRLYSTRSLDAAFLPDENAGMAGAFDGKNEETFELPLESGPFFKAVIDPATPAAQ